MHLECYKVFGSSSKTNMDLCDEIGSSGRNQQKPEEALLKKTFVDRKKKCCGVPEHQSGEQTPVNH